MQTSRSGSFSYPLCVGILLGVLQTGLLFQLSFTLSSGFGTYLLMTVCWLVGGAIGVLHLASLRVSLNAYLLTTLAAYFACVVALALVPFATSLWPVYGMLVALMGIYPGVFFARQSATYTASRLFFHENNGFILGLVVGTVFYAVWGRLFVWLAPVLLGSVILLLQARRQPS